MTVTAAELAALLARHAGPLELYASQWTDVPEDVVQEAFVALAAQRVRPDDPVAWLYRVVRNKAISAARSSRRRRTHEAAAGQLAVRLDTPEHCGLEAQEAAEALARLPAEQREVIVAHLWGGLSFEQIAEAVGRPRSTVHRHYQQGLESLRAMLESPCYWTSR